MQQEEDAEPAGDPGHDEDHARAEHDPASARRLRRGRRRRPAAVGGAASRCNTRDEQQAPRSGSGRPTTIVIFAQAGTGRKNAEAAPTSTKATISSRCAHSRLPPARENPGQRGPAVTFSTATFEASPRPSRQDRVEERSDGARRVHRAEADRRRAHRGRPCERAQRLHRRADREAGEQVAPVRRCGSRDRRASRSAGRAARRRPPRPGRSRLQTATPHLHLHGIGNSPRAGEPLEEGKGLTQSGPGRSHGWRRPHDPTSGDRSAR